MISLYFVPFGLLLAYPAGPLWIQIILAVLMGLGTAGIGLDIMHDANHGVFSSNRKLNVFIGYIINFIGGNSFNWKMQHNVLHHTYTNVHGIDEDIDVIPIMRFSPHAKYRKIHRFQYIYAWFLYGLMTMWWSTGKDFVQLIRYQKQNLVKSQQTTFTNQFIRLIISKALYWSFILIVPIWLGGYSILHWLVLLFVMHYVGGLLMALIFQPAHVTIDSSFPLPVEGSMEDHFLLHQMHTTANFGNKSRLLGWLAGGLNFQIEHHLFPNISHIHYRHISKIVQETAKEFGLPYRQYKTFGGALIAHGKMLYDLGKPAMIPVSSATQKPLRQRHS